MTMRVSKSVADVLDRRNPGSPVAPSIHSTTGSGHGLQRRVLCICLSLALGSSASVGLADGLPPDIPLQWPLPYARDQSTPPLRARLEAMRLSPTPQPDRAPRQWLVENCAPRVRLRKNGIQQMTNGGFFVITRDNDRDKGRHFKGKFPKIGYFLTSGRNTSKVAPSPCLLRTLILPPCACTISCAIASPNPAPCAVPPLRDASA